MTFDQIKVYSEKVKVLLGALKWRSPSGEKLMRGGICTQVLRSTAEKRQKMRLCVKSANTVNQSNAPLDLLYFVGDG